MGKNWHFRKSDGESSTLIYSLLWAPWKAKTSSQVVPGKNLVNSILDETEKIQKNYRLLIFNEKIENFIGVCSILEYKWFILFDSVKKNRDFQ